MKEGFEKGRAELDVADGADDRVVEVVEVVGNEVGQGRVLGVAPEGFDRIEVGSVGGRPRSGRIMMSFG